MNRVDMQQAPDTNQKSGASAQVSPLDRTSATRTFLVRIYTLDWLVSISEENIFLLLPSSSSPCCFPAHKAALAVVADSDRYRQVAASSAEVCGRLPQTNNRMALLFETAFFSDMWRASSSFSPSLSPCVVCVLA